jgi:hypothetical protein
MLALRCKIFLKVAGIKLKIPRKYSSRDCLYFVYLIQKKQIFLPCLLAILIFSSNAFSLTQRTPDLNVVIYTVRDQDGDIAGKSTYISTERVLVKVDITNFSSNKSNVPKGLGFTRPTLIRGKKVLPYKSDVLEQFESNDGGLVSGLVGLNPGQSTTEIIDLNTLYGPLKEGKYELIAERRFFNSARVTSNSVEFEVVLSETRENETLNSKNANKVFESKNNKRIANMLATSFLFKPVKVLRDFFSSEDHKRARISQ